LAETGIVPFLVLGGNKQSVKYLTSFLEERALFYERHRQGFDNFFFMRGGG